LDERICNLLREADWENITLELTDYAVMKVKRLRWRTGSYESLPQGKTPDDLAYDAIEKVLSGDRRWNPNKNPNLLNYLKTVVDSLVSHLVESEEHKRVQRLPETKDGVDLEEMLPLDSRLLAHRPKNPEEILLEKEREKQVWSKIIEAANGDIELEVLVEALKEDYAKPGEIAQEWQLDVKEVYQSIRKLKRRIAKLEENQEIANLETSQGQRRK